MTNFPDVEEPLNREDPKVETIMSVQDRRNQVFVLASLIIVLLMTIISLWLVIITLDKPTKVPPVSSETSNARPIACLECRLMQLNNMTKEEDDPLLKQLSRTRFRNDPKPKCCAYNSTQMSAMLEATMRRLELPHEELKSYNASDFKFSPASAHMRYYPPSGDMKQGVVFTPKLISVTFKTSPNQEAFNEHARGVTVSDSGFKIQFSGLYMVYSSIEYKPYHVGRCNDLTYQTWSHFVILKKARSLRETRLLQTALTCCQECYQTEDTRFTSGVFRLEKGDEVGVQVMGYGLHHYAKDTSFLGVVMMGMGQEPTTD